MDVTFYTPQEIAVMIDESVSPGGTPESGLLLATRAQAAATLYVGEVLSEILYEMQVKR